ncbi:MAG: hypothetical protein IPJ84_19575 [Bdellovibrionales bacterium]|nr:hypothetical protein [Bdellovibrionales bacterium]
MISNWLSVYFAALLLCSTASAIEAECVRWFNAAKISPLSNDCVAKCSALSVDMGTFTCSDRGDDLCRASVHSCEEIRAEIGKSLKDGDPPKWERRAEHTKRWTPAEKAKVISAFLRLPVRIRDSKNVHIYRMKTSADKGNPASTLGSSTVLYDAAFRADVSLDQILAHELAHHFFATWSDLDREAYELAGNWIRPPGIGRPIPGRKASEFVQEDGVISPEEDFANNIEALLYDDTRLKKVSPGVHRWLHNYFGDSLKVGGLCATK